jgi:G-patch protein
MGGGADGSASGSVPGVDKGSGASDAAGGGASSAGTDSGAGVNSGGGSSGGGWDALRNAEQMMRKMGWKAGQGLGRGLSGRVDPVLPEKMPRGSGLGYQMGVEVRGTYLSVLSSRCA